MSSVAGAAGGVGELDLNCETAPILDNGEAGGEDSVVRVGVLVLGRERGELLEGGVDGQNEFESRLAGPIDGIAGNGEGSGGFEPAGESDEGVVGTVVREAETESHVGELLELDLGETRSVGLVVLSSAGHKTVQTNGQIIDFGDESAGDQERDIDVGTEGMIRIDEDSLAVLSDDRGADGGRLEGSTILRKEELVAQVGLVDGSGQVVDGILGVEELEAEGVSHGHRFSEVVTWEIESANLVFSAEQPEDVESGNKSMVSEDGSGSNQKQGTGINADSMDKDDQLGPRESEAEAKSHCVKFLNMDKEEGKGSPGLVAVSTEGFEPVESSSHAVDFYDGCCSNHRGGTNFDAEGMVIVDEFGSQKMEAEVVSLGGKISELNRGEIESKELVTVLAEGIGPVKASIQPMDLGDESNTIKMLDTDLDAKGMVEAVEDSNSVSDCCGRKLSELNEENESEDLVSVEVFGPVKASSRAMEVSDGSGDVQVLGTDVDSKCTDKAFVSISGGGKLLESDKEKGNTELVAISTQLLEPVKASCQPIDLADVSGGVQMISTDVDAKCRVGINEDSFSRSVGTGVKLLEFVVEDQGIADLAAISTKIFEPVTASNPAIDLEDGSGDFQELVTDIDANGMVRISEGSVCISAHGAGKLLELDKEEKGKSEQVAISSKVFESVKGDSQGMDLSDGSGDDEMQETDLDAEVMVRIDKDSISISVSSGEKLFELERDEKESTELVDISTEVDGHAKISGQFMDLVDLDGDDQRLGTDIEAVAIIRNNEDSVANSIDNGRPKEEMLVVPPFMRKEQVEVWGDMEVRKCQIVDDELGTGYGKDEVKPYVEGCVAVGMMEKESTKLVAASAESKAVVARAVDSRNGSVDDQEPDTYVYTKGKAGTDDSFATLVLGGGPGGERLEGSLILREEKHEVHMDLADGSGQGLNCQFFHGEREAEVESHGGKLFEVDKGDKEKSVLVAVSTEDFEDIETSYQAMNIENDSCGGQKQDIDVDAEALVIDGQLGPAERDTELNSHCGKFLEANKGVKGSTELVSFSTDGLEPVVGSIHAMYFGDGSDDDQKDVADLTADAMVTDGELHREADQSHGRDILEFDVGEKGRAELFSVSNEGYELKSSTEAMEMGDGSVDNQGLVSNVDADAMVTTDEGSVVISVVRGCPGDERLEEPAVLGIDHVEVLRKSDGCGWVAEGELITGKRLLVVETYGDQKLVANVDADCMVGTNEDSLNISSARCSPKDGCLEGSPFLEKEHFEVHLEVVEACDQILNDVFSQDKKEAVMDTGLIGNTEPVSASSGGVYTVDSSSQGMDLEDGYSTNQKQGSNINSENVARTDENSFAIPPEDRGPGNEMLDLSSNLVKDDTKVGEEIGEIGTAEKDLGQPMKAEVIGLDTMIHSDGDGVSEDGRLETSYKFGENKVDVEEDNSRPGLSKLSFSYPKKVGSVEVIASTNFGHVKEIVQEHVENLGFKKGCDGDKMPESRLEADAVPLVAPVTCQGVESQGMVSAIEKDDELVGVSYSCYGSQMMEKIAHGNAVNADVIGEHPCERKGELIGGHNQYIVNYEFSSEDQNMMITSLACPPERVETADDSEEHHAVDETVVSYEKHDINLGTSQIAVLEFMGGETSLAYHSMVDSNQLEVHTQRSSVENDQKINHKNNTVACEEVQELDPAPITEELDSGSCEADGGMKITVVAVDAAANVEEWNSCGHTADNILEKEEVVLEDNGIVTSIAPAEQQNVSAQQSFDIHNRKEDSSSIMVSFRGEEAHAADMIEDHNRSEGCNDTITESSSTSQQATYDLSFPEKEGFSPSDLVWGKVKSHPWWPGQIFDFSGASKLALKYQKKDHFLVAYFGDKTFAWCEESRLKPFHQHFSQMEKQTSSDSFLCALHDILMEVSRRVELSMTCLCLPEETYADIEYQKVENAGVRGKTVSSVVDRYEIVNYFHPDKLLDYVRDLASIPNGGADRLELTVAQAQLKAFYLFKGYTELPSFTNGSGLVENDFEIPTSTSKSPKEDDLDHSATLNDLFSTKVKSRVRDGTLGTQKCIAGDGRKLRNMSELMEEETPFSIVNDDENTSTAHSDERCLLSCNKRKAVGYFSSDFERIKTKKIDSPASKETKLPSPTFNSSFKVGEFISRAASKLTCGQPHRKCYGEKTDDWPTDHMDIDDFLDFPVDNPKLWIDTLEEYPPASEMLSKLCLAARNPLKGYNFSSIVISFFSAFRNLRLSNFSIETNNTEKPRAKRGRKKKVIPDLELPDTSTPDHMKDSYWSDMIVPEKDAILNPPKRRGRKKRKFMGESSPSDILNSPSDFDSNLHIGSMCSHVKHILIAERPIITVEEKNVDERTPTAMILYFNCSDSLPSDIDLIRIFSRYGPLKEEETSIETKTNTAMVVFKKRADAEMAFSSAGKFSTFGPALVSYRLRHFPSKSYPVKALKDEEHGTPIKDGKSGILVDPESGSTFDGDLCENIPPVRLEGDDREPSNFSRTREDAGDMVKRETGIASDNLLLESLDQELSYFDLDIGECGEVATVNSDIPGTEVRGEKSSSIDQTVRENTRQPEAINLELYTTSRAEVKNVRDELNLSRAQPGQNDLVGNTTSDRSSVATDAMEGPAIYNESVPDEVMVSSQAVVLSLESFGPDSDSTHSGGHIKESSVSHKAEANARIV